MQIMVRGVLAAMSAAASDDAPRQLQQQPPKQQPQSQVHGGTVAMPAHPSGADRQATGDGRGQQQQQQEVHQQGAAEGLEGTLTVQAAAAEHQEQQSLQG